MKTKTTIIDAMNAYFDAKPRNYMNQFIEIHDNNTNETGTYSIWYKDNGETKKRILSESQVWSLLDMRQKEDFFIGKYKFKIKSEYDFKKIILSDPK